MNEVIEKSSKGYKVGSLAATPTTISIFMPWMIVSFGRKIAQQAVSWGRALKRGLYTVFYGKERK